MCTVRSIFQASSLDRSSPSARHVKPKMCPPSLHRSWVCSGHRHRHRCENTRAHGPSVDSIISTRSSRSQFERHQSRQRTWRSLRRIGLLTSLQEGSPSCRPRQAGRYAARIYNQARPASRFAPDQGLHLPRAPRPCRLLLQSSIPFPSFVFLFFLFAALHSARGMLEVRSSWWKRMFSSVSSAHPALPDGHRRHRFSSSSTTLLTRRSGLRRAFDFEPEEKPSRGNGDNNVLSRQRAPVPVPALPRGAGTGAGAK